MEAGILRNSGENIFPSSDQEQGIYALQPGERLFAESNTGQGVNDPKRVEALGQMLFASLAQLIGSGAEFRVVPARDPNTCQIIPGRVAIITKSDKL